MAQLVTHDLLKERDAPERTRVDATAIEPDLTGANLRGLRVCDKGSLYRGGRMLVAGHRRALSRADTMPSGRMVTLGMQHT